MIETKVTVITSLEDPGDAHAPYLEDIGKRFMNGAGDREDDPLIVCAFNSSI